MVKIERKVCRDTSSSQSMVWGTKHDRRSNGLTSGGFIMRLSIDSQYSWPWAIDIVLPSKSINAFEPLIEHQNCQRGGTLASLLDTKELES